LRTAERSGRFRGQDRRGPSLRGMTKFRGANSVPPLLHLGKGCQRRIALHPCPSARPGAARARAAKGRAPAIPCARQGRSPSALYSGIRMFVLNPQKFSHMLISI
jgi:hypothetical protein